MPGKKIYQSRFEKIVDSLPDRKYIYGAVLHLTSGDNEIDLIRASGNIDENSQYYIASINKLFISAIILRLYNEDYIDLSDRLSVYLQDEIVKGIHTYKGKDYSYKLTINHLLSQTSGLPCYLMDKQSNRRRAMSELEAGIDQEWPIEKVIHAIKGMQAHFPPGTKNYAKYADTNHQILSLIIERITGEPLNLVLQRLFRELNLAQTYVCEDINNLRFIPVRYKSNVVDIPLFLTSTRNDIISSARDLMAFLRLFFAGYFLPSERIKELEKWNRIFFPFHYGIGIQKFTMPRILSLGRSIPALIGHCGSTGSVAFFVPELDLYITGTTNQQARPNIIFQAIIKVLNSLR
jgi:CubicO group peptidase (beta-lactamase class C family)